MKVKTVSYINCKLDRTPGRNETTTEIVMRKLKSALIRLGEVILSMSENGHKQIIRIEGERMKHIIEVSRRKRNKVIDPVGIQILNDLKYGRW